MIIDNPQQALEKLKPHGYRGPNRLWSEQSGAGGKVKANAKRFKRPINPTSPSSSGSLMPLGTGSQGMIGV
jgi:hypothetical protein